jgi:hypothetical protein
VTVLKLQLPSAGPPAVVPLPVAAVSLPFTGSTKYWLPVVAPQLVQVLFTQTPLAPEHWASVQQVPATHAFPQQMSAGLAAHAVPVPVQVCETQVPWLAPAAVRQM